MRVAIGLVLLGGVVLAACIPGTGEECPSVDERRDDPGLAVPIPQPMYAEAASGRKEFASGPSIWCGVFGDVFEVGTSAEPLIVAPREEVRVPDPLDANVIESFLTVRHAGVPTPENGWLIWPQHGWGGGPEPHATNYSVYYDNLFDNDAEFHAPSEPGRYIVVARLVYDREDEPGLHGRSAYYALLLEVRE